MSITPNEISRDQDSVAWMFVCREHKNIQAAVCSLWFPGGKPLSTPFITRRETSTFQLILSYNLGCIQIKMFER